MKRWSHINIIMLLVLTPLLVLAAEDEPDDSVDLMQSPTGVLDISLFEFEDTNWSYTTRPLYDSLIDGPIYWSRFQGDYFSGPHHFQVLGGSATYTDPFGFYQDLPINSFQTSFTYRYHGLLGGIVRPVMRVTTGVSQRYDPIGAGSFSGLYSGYTGYVVPEAGLEFVIRGYGLGVTASYPMTWDLMNPETMHDDLTGGPLSPRPDLFDPRRIRYNLYPIIE